MRKPILSAENLNKAFGNKKVLENISFSIDEGDIFGLLGPNGAGKTTLIRIISQIFNQDSGKILYKGDSLSKKHLPLFGYLPEERGLYKKMTVFAHLLYLAKLRKLDKNSAIENIGSWLEKFQMEHYSNMPIEKLSKGNQQKVQFVAAILHDPDIIILDEPFSGFDPVNAEAVKQEILRLNAKGKTIIFSSHRMENVEELCESVAFISHSNIVSQGSKIDILEEYSVPDYIIKIKSEFEGLEDFGTVNNVSKDNLGYFEYLIRIEDESNIRKLQQAITKQTEIISFNKQLPSLHDVFLKIIESN